MSGWNTYASSIYNFINIKDGGINRTQTNRLYQRGGLKNKAYLTVKAHKSSGSLTVINANYWRQFIEKEVGFILPDAQLQWLLNAVEHTANNYELSLEQLWLVVQTDKKVRQRLIDAVLIIESRFFRHPPSIQFVTQLAMQSDQQYEKCSTNFKGKTVSPFRIWSVGCSTGQEVWSLAMSLAAQHIESYSILGTDVSQKALIRAYNGQYDYRQRETIPQQCQQFIQPLDVSGDNLESSQSLDDESSWQVDARLRKHVTFLWHNLFTHSSPLSGAYEVIICQNVLIYFRQFDQRDILTRLAAQCAVGGHIVLSPGEGLGWRPNNMRRIKSLQVNAWQKIKA